jgi:hypothetical protein
LVTTAVPVSGSDALGVGADPLGFDPDALGVGADSLCVSGMCGSFDVLVVVFPRWPLAAQI